MMLDAALAYARHGIPVLPVHTPARDGSCSCGRPDCDRPGKHPRLRHGLTDATVDPRRIEMWWSRWPEANIGLRTGTAMDVADVDSPTGWHGLRHILGGAMPVGPQVRTGSGGWHFWFAPLGYGNRVHLLPGVDWRGAGGYVVAPPSRHASGTFYYWVVRPGADPPSAPDVLRDLIAGPDPPFPGHGDSPGAGWAGSGWAGSGSAGTGSAGSGWAGSGSAGTGSAGTGSAGTGSAGTGSAGTGSAGTGSAGTGSAGTGSAGTGSAGTGSAGTGSAGTGSAGSGWSGIVHPERYAAVALEAEIDRVARALVGTRNDTLNRAAFALGRLVGAGFLDAATVSRELMAAGAWCGLGRAETIRTIRSGLSAGRRFPLNRAPTGRPQSAATQPSATQPSATQPSAAQPSAAQPSYDPPKAAEPGYARPRVTQPKTAQRKSSPESSGQAYSGAASPEQGSSARPKQLGEHRPEAPHPARAPGTPLPAGDERQRPGTERGRHTKRLDDIDGDRVA